MHRRQSIRDPSFAIDEGKGVYRFLWCLCEICSFFSEIRAMSANVVEQLAAATASVQGAPIDPAPTGDGGGAPGVAPQADHVKLI